MNDDDDVRCCEMCKMFSGCVRLRRSDQNLCESCHSYEKSLTRSQGNIIEDETQSKMASAMMVPHSLSEDDGAAMAIEADKVNHHEDSHHEIDDNMVCEGVSDILVKKSSDTMELCKKCERKLVNGVRCARCKNGLHWKCEGVSKDSVKSEVIANKDWSCAFCRNSSKKCISCKQKEKEIKNLKSNIAEMEKAMQHLNYELKQNTERFVDLEDRLCREKKLRKRVEKDFDELKKEMEHNETSTCSSCDSQSSETDQRSPRKEDRRKKFTKKVKLQSSKSKDQYGKAKNRKQSFSESELVVQNERNPTVIGSQRQRQPKKNPFLKTGPLQMGTKLLPAQK